MLLIDVEDEEDPGVYASWVPALRKLIAKRLLPRFMLLLWGREAPLVLLVYDSFCSPVIVSGTTSSEWALQRFPSTAIDV